MVRECLKNQSDFGICLLTDAEELSNPPSIFPTGTSVEIIDWDRDENGFLIVTQGLQKFRIKNTTLQPNDLLLGEVELLPPAQHKPMPTQYSDLTDLIRKAMLNLGALADYTENDLKDSVWVGNRLVEALPMSAEVRHNFMVIDDPIEQLDALQKFINSWHP